MLSTSRRLAAGLLASAIVASGATLVRPAYAESEAGGTTVLSAGDVRLAYSLEDTKLGMQVTTEVEGERAWFDPDSVVFSVPNQDPEWPGTGGNAAAKRSWGLLVTEGSPSWRTLPAATSAPVNDLVLGWDTGRIDSGKLETAQVGQALATVTGPESAYVASYSLSSNRPTSYLNSRPLTTAVSLDVIPATSSGEGLADAATGRGFLFSAEGVYCVGVDSWAQLAGELIPAWNRTTLTFVVGDDIDPASVVPCAQEADPEQAALVGNDYDTSDGPAVLREGDIRLATVSDEAGQIGFQVLDLSGSEERRFDPEGVILHIPHADTSWPGESWAESSTTRTAWSAVYPSSTRQYRTSGVRPLVAGEAAVLQHLRNPLLLSLDAGYVSSYGPGLPGSVSTALLAVTSESDGYFYGYDTRRVDAGAITQVNQFLFWDSRDRREGGTLGASVNDFAAGSGAAPDPAERRRSIGWAFSEPGVYCVTLQSQVNRTESGWEPALAQATFTAVVGEEIDPKTVMPCVAGDNEGPVAGADIGVEGAHYLLKGHSDIGVTRGNEGYELYASDGVDHQNYPLDDVVMVGNTAFNRQTVPTPTAGNDYSFIGPAGTEFWSFSQAPTYSSQTVWPGFSSLGTLVDGEVTTRGGINWTLRGATGPGDVILYTSEAKQGDITALWYSTRDGLPSSRTQTVSHEHASWAFTAPGRYCLAFGVSLVTKDTSERHDLYGVLTVAVGDDLDLATLAPCGYDEGFIVPVGPLAELGTESSTSEVVQTGRTTFVPYLDNGELEVTTTLRGSISDVTRSVDPESLVLSSTVSAGGSWLFGVYQAGGSPDQWWDSRYLQAADIDDVTLTLGEVDGPGSVHFIRNSATPTEIALDNRTPSGSRSTYLWPGWSEGAVTVQFSQSGVYCVPLTWAGTVEGRAVSGRKTLTYAVGSTTPGDPSYVNRVEVAPCAGGGQGDEPGGEPGEPGNDGEAPNSDATVLDDGHVDLASFIENGALMTAVKLDSGDLLPVDSVVLYVSPLARQSIPADSAYGFLGAEGADSWILPETARSLLLWPGWSTEMIELGSIDGVVRWTLDEVSGPGEFALFTNADLGGAPGVLFDSHDGVTDQDAFDIPVGTHAHANWAFSAEGVYCLAFERSAAMAGGTPVSDAFTLAVAVGETDPTLVDPANCVATEPAPAPSAPSAVGAPVVSVDGDVVTVSWAAPADGGSPITGYTVTLAALGAVPLVQEVAADAAEAVFHGVPDGVWSATVVAANAVGAAPASPQSAPTTVTTPTDPTDPVDPTDPTDPTDPADPADPTDPADPADPADPIDPTDPTDPTGPADPINPADPTDPTDPADPTDLADPTDDPTDAPTDTPPVPVDEGEMTDAHRGGVDVPESAWPGQSVTVTVVGYAGGQVRIWLHSYPVLLGTFTLDHSGRATVVIPAGSALGEHRIVVQAMDGPLVGWDTIRLEAAGSNQPTTPPATGQPTSAAPATGGLPVTGASGPLPLLGGLALVFVLAGAAAASATRSRAASR